MLNLYLWKVVDVATPFGGILRFEICKSFSTYEVLGDLQVVDVRPWISMYFSPKNWPWNRGPSIRPVKGHQGAKGMHFWENPPAAQDHFALTSCEGKKLCQQQNSQILVGNQSFALHFSAEVQILIGGFKPVEK